MLTTMLIGSLLLQPPSIDSLLEGAHEVRIETEQTWDEGATMSDHSGSAIGPGLRSRDADAAMDVAAPELSLPGGGSALGFGSSTDVTAGMMNPLFIIGGILILGAAFLAYPLRRFRGSLIIGGIGAGTIALGVTIETVPWAIASIVLAILGVGGYCGVEWLRSRLERERDSLAQDRDNTREALSILKRTIAGQPEAEAALAQLRTSLGSDARAKKIDEA